jgi:anti-anti-sigma factor
MDGSDAPWPKNPGLRAEATVADNPFPVQWTGQQAVVTLPRHIDDSSTDQVRDQLLWLINRGAGVLIADLTGTVYCDYSGAYALARAQQCASARGTELRLVTTSDVARRVFTLSGPGRPVAVYPDLGGAIAAGAESRTPQDHARAGN